MEYAIKHGFNTVVIGRAELFGQLVSPQATRRLTITTGCRASSERAVSIFNRPALRCRELGLRFYLQGERAQFPDGAVVSASGTAG